MDTTPILEKLKVKHVLIGTIALFAIAGLCAVEFTSSRTPAASQPVAATPAPASVSAPVVAAAAPQVSASAAAAAIAQVMIPGSPPPAGLTPGAMTYALQEPDQNAWTTLGTAKLDARMASFTTVTPNSLATYAPSEGLIRQTWMFYYQQPADGQDTFILHLQGQGDVDASVAIDDAQDPQISASLRNSVLQDGPPVNAAHQINLATGWHKLVVSFTHRENRYVHKNSAGELAVLLPGKGAPDAVIPATIDPVLAAQQAEQAQRDAAKAASATAVAASASQTPAVSAASTVASPVTQVAAAAPKGASSSGK